jgi:hypothetical protein
MDAFLKETGGTKENKKIMQDILVKAAIHNICPEHFVCEVELLAGPDHAEIVLQKLENTDDQIAIDRVHMIQWNVPIVDLPADLTIPHC